jgi:hypothetical protein
LELFGVCMITARHTEIAQNELRKKCQIEPEESDNRGHFPEQLRVHFPGNLRPPEMKAPHERHDHSADHNVMKMRDHEISVMYMHIHGQRCQEYPGHTTNSKKANETDGVQHGRIQCPDKA